VVDSFGYIVAGETNSGVLKEMWRYNPFNDSWTRESDLSATARENGTGFVLNSKIYYG
jgi:hypothetical protein